LATKQPFGKKGSSEKPQERAAIKIDDNIAAPVVGLIDPIGEKLAFMIYFLRGAVNGGLGITGWPGSKNKRTHIATNSSFDPLILAM
jgi:hypothetical protein